MFIRQSLPNTVHRASRITLSLYWPTGCLAFADPHALRPLVSYPCSTPSIPPCKMNEPSVLWIPLWGYFCKCAKMGRWTPGIMSWKVSKQPEGTDLLIPSSLSFAGGQLHRKQRPTYEKPWCACCILHKSTHPYWVHHAFSLFPSLQPGAARGWAARGSGQRFRSEYNQEMNCVSS